MPADDDRSFICPCCQLRQAKETDQHGVTAPVCRHCTWHQGAAADRRLARAERHEELLRERLDRCRSSEATAQAEARKAREAAAAALASRGRLADRLDNAAALEPAYRLNALLGIVRDNDVQAWARKQRAIDERRDAGW